MAVYLLIDKNIVGEGTMKSKSSSVKYLPSSHIPKDYPNHHMQFYSRLAFPESGNSLFYHNSGRKHYENHSQKLLKIVLPSEYAYRNPLPAKEPYLIPSSNPETSSYSSKKSLPKIEPLHYRLGDQLDKMKEIIDKKKQSPISRTPQAEQIHIPPKPSSQRSLPPKEEKRSIVEEIILKKEEKRVEQKLASPSSLAKKVEQKSGSAAVSLSLKQSVRREDPMASMRAKNPSFLSSCISYI